MSNTKHNIRFVWVKGHRNSDDDGYLNYAKNQDQISTQNDEAAYRNYYAMLINSPYNYTLPRTIRLGVQFSF